jgi:hypothetical protein
VRLVIQFFFACPLRGADSMTGHVTRQFEGGNYRNHETLKAAQLPGPIKFHCYLFGQRPRQAVDPAEQSHERLDVCLA